MSTTTMIAVKSPMIASPSGMMSAFSPYSNSPSSPAAHNKTARASTLSQEMQENRQSLAPPPNQPSSSNDLPDPSPSSSTGTDITEFEDTGNVEPEQEPETADPRTPYVHTPYPDSAGSSQPELSLKTISASRISGYKPRSDEDEPPQSVIHAPAGFGQFRVATAPPTTGRVSTSPSQKSDVTIKSPTALEVKSIDQKVTDSPSSPPALDTAVASARDWAERATPRAQTRQEFEFAEKRPKSTGLEDIPETQDGDGAQDEEQSDTAGATVGNFQDSEDEIKALNTALAECWTLCNTLASLSHIHRERLFNFQGKNDTQEQAWKSCWKLCQKLYDSRDEDYAAQVRPTLDLCRDFCQALFEVRVVEDEVADSVLRVSFELNNHLYNTHDRNLPEAFRERTLDFYITLCHRLMKQKSTLTEETGPLLKACWSLAEMLFSLRQTKREGKRPDEELLGSALQAAWTMCDLFREGWTQIRPDRGTPRPSQTTFTQAFNQAKRAGLTEKEGQRGNPETPTTIFEDTVTVSPEEVPVPNILVLGQTQTRAHSQGPRSAGPRWSSASSTLSGYSQSSEQTTSSTHTVTTPSEDPNLTRLKVLVIKAAMNSGFQRGTNITLPNFAKTLSTNSFGSAPWQTTLLDSYKRLVVTDPAFRNIGPPTRATASDVAIAVQAMVHSGQYAWLRDLFRLVFGFHVEEAKGRKNVIQT